jgi:hypothetical protein
MRVTQSTDQMHTDSSIGKHDISHALAEKLATPSICFAERAQLGEGHRAWPSRTTSDCTLSSTVSLLR